ncbi:MAG: hypothetical protein RL514_3252 [Verrucomicrobiota bacterium]|jgi:hypothetical protein
MKLETYPSPLEGSADAHVRSGCVDRKPLGKQRLRTCASALLALLAALMPASAATPTLVHSAATAGGRQTVGNVVVDSAIGGLGGSSSVTTFAARNGFVGQLTDVQGVAVSASPSTVNEGSTRQLTAMATFTDGTLLPLSGTTATWSVSGGGLAAVNTSGLTTAATVYQDTNGIARADYLGRFGTLTLSVLNVNADDFGTYAGDTIDDAWQVQHFGIGSASAAPTADPDGDGQNNLFEYLAGTTPTSAASLMTLAVAKTGTDQRTVSFAPIAAGRSYTVEFATSLTTKNFTPLSGTPVDNAVTRTFTDNSATDAARYYRVKITLP